jgi:DNA-binding YbaB/EbfC family protein
LRPASAFDTLYQRISERRASRFIIRLTAEPDGIVGLGPGESGPPCHDNEFQSLEATLVFGIKELMEHAQGLQSKIAALQEQLAEKTVTGSSGGDMVVVEANGAQEITSIKIEDELISADDTEMLEDLLVAAVNDALRKSKEMVAEEVSKLTGGIRLPGLT